MSNSTSTKPALMPREPTGATDHLANERTFLAWIRTSLAAIGLGFAVAKFGTWLRELSGQSVQLAEVSGSTRSFVVGLLMIGTGGAVAIVAALRYKAVARQIEEGTVVPANATVVAVTVVVLVVTVAVGGLTLTATPR